MNEPPDTKDAAELALGKALFEVVHELLSAKQPVF
jgi:hypothetical protein